MDFGGQHIGIAVGESGHGVVSPRSNLSASGTLKRDAEAIHNLAKKEQATDVVVGLPLSDGEDTKMSKVCRKLGEEIAKLGWNVHYVDESLTSHASEQEMLQAGLKGSERRKRVDGEAAARILERFFGQ